MQKNLFRVARLLDGMSQLEVAARSGINVSVVSQIENGWRIPTPNQISRLKKVLPGLRRVESLMNELSPGK